LRCGRQARGTGSDYGNSSAGFYFRKRRDTETVGESVLNNFVLNALNGDRITGDAKDAR
jgi:hypothetical protein